MGDAEASSADWGADSLTGSVSCDVTAAGVASEPAAQATPFSLSASDGLAKFITSTTLGGALSRIISG